MTDPKEVERLMVEGARLMRKAIAALDEVRNNHIDVRVNDTALVRAHLASKPAPEAGECRGCELAKLGADMSAASHTCTPAPKPEAGECKGCAYERKHKTMVEGGIHTCEASRG